MENVKMSRIATAALVVSSIVGTYFFAGPRNRKKRTDVVPAFKGELDANLATPANGTFAAVWPVIYTGTLGLAVHQALPSQVDNPRYEKAAPWLVVNYLLNALFGVFFSRGEKSARVAANAITVAQLPTVLALHHALEVGKTEVAEPERTFQRTVGIYAGWITVATGVATTNLLIEAGYRVSPKRAEPYAVGLLSILGGIGLAVSKKLNDPYYLLPFVAGFTGVAAKQYGRNSTLAGVSGALALTVAGVFVQRIREAQADVTELGNDQIAAEAAREEMAEEPYYIDMD
ncbi:tryptophan-rich sensory protein [Fibrella aquatilis]|uniref:Tryptophan-rich sensory protein n=1 Tax=Fibrella aquatilis TaxID=2817059 RepID=A0A939GD71_9BACT|nr:tryptophan-rich sensory protein [Fibrella aquatilis]MBO0934218.1 tryptophan-rich sensory protein [Fibrella aquatilis]